MTTMEKMARSASVQQANNSLAGQTTDEQEPSSRDCPICGGDGFLIGDDDAEVQCDTCDGSGQAPRKPQVA
jgi:DnaJ-class molecular chaperone